MSKINSTVETIKWTDLWKMAGVMALAIRLVSGWTYWGGASRRFIYAPAKLDFTSHAYLANKLVHAAPGMAFDLSGVMHWLLAHATLLHISIIFFSLVELVVGLGLIFGIATRLMSIIGLGLASVLMIIFGWMGTTCLDEWTMAALGFAACAVTFITGGGRYSVDQLFSSKIEKMPYLAWLTSGPLPISQKGLIKLSAALGIISFIFTVFFYGYNYGALVTPLSKRVDSAHHHVLITHARFQHNQIMFSTYINSGPDTQGLYIVDVKVQANGKTLLDLNPKDLNNHAIVSLSNTYAPWSTCKQVNYSIRCQLGSKSKWLINLPTDVDISGNATLILTNVEGHQFSTTLNSL